MAKHPPRVLIVEGHQLLADVLALALRLQGFVEVETCRDLTLEGVVGTAARVRPDVVLLDLHPSDRTTAVPMVKPLVRRGATVLILAGSQARPLLAECLEAGAAGIFDKQQPFDRLVGLLDEVDRGHTPLSPAARAELIEELRARRRAEHDLLAPFERLTTRERAVLRALIDGRSAETIALEGTVSVATVRTQIRSILQKLGANSQLAAVAIARRAGWHGG